MDWYINESNQNLLWNMIHRVPSVSSIPLSMRETTFKNIIEYYYGVIPNHQSLNLSQKKEINRNTISDFLAKIQNQFPHTTPRSDIDRHTYEPNPPNNSIPHKMFESKQDKSQREFTERQQIYEQMTAKPDIPSADIFREKANPDDDTIHNMDDLIKKYQLDREKDMQLLSPINERILPPGNKTVNQSRQKVSFINDPVIIPSIVVLEETVLQNVEELNSSNDSREDKHVLQEMRQYLSQCIDIFQDISLNQKENSSSSFTILQEKIYSMKTSLEEHLREKNIT